MTPSGLVRCTVMTGALALALAGCGGTSDDPVTSASGAAAGTASSTGSGAPTTQAPSDAPSGGPRQCPVKARSVPAPAGAQTDLTKKPSVAANTAPPPADVTVADLVVGTGAVATTLSSVEAKYVGSLYTTGQEFDSSWKTSVDTTIPFTVCATGTIPGFAVAPTGMKVGGRREVTIPAALAYGAQGQPPTIPANAVLVFVIDLVKVTPPAG